jgi:hypothetical protein
MAKVQANMKQCLEKQTLSMDSLTRLSDALHSTTTTTSSDYMNGDDDDGEQHETATVGDVTMMMMTTDDDVQDDEEEDVTDAKLTQKLLAAKKLKGENVAPKSTIYKKANRKSKHVMKGEKNGPKEKRRPRYFVQF